MALRRPPGLTRKRFGFQGWMDYDVQLWTALRDEERRGVGRRNNQSHCRQAVFPHSTDQTQFDGIRGCRIGLARTG